ncbi:MAG: hypothetical protein A3G24_10720 [Betaproteobacteria bacterium RIFCSPLOWO2_12_FULL_62_13]|nr:MAG: hypothetical protein A3G24_10720 [Betaproteobacteria bacterium RIFCSPLOWO2_12_FULL_62_13]
MQRKAPARAARSTTRFILPNLLAAVLICVNMKTRGKRMMVRNLDLVAARGSGFRHAGSAGRPEEDTANMRLNSQA